MLTIICSLVGAVVSLIVGRYFADIGMHRKVGPVTEAFCCFVTLASIVVFYFLLCVAAACALLPDFLDRIP